MLHFQEETFAQVRDGVQALVQAHWDEVEAALHGDLAYSLDKERFGARDRVGMLAVITARHEDGPLAGYAAFTVLPCPHRAGITLAALDGLYLAPDARRGLAALNLLRRAEQCLARRGVGLIQYSSPASRPCDALYRRLGARHTESVWHKSLTHEEER